MPFLLPGQQLILQLDDLCLRRQQLFLQVLDLAAVGHRLPLLPFRPCGIHDVSQHIAPGPARFGGHGFGCGRDLLQGHRPVQGRAVPDEHGAFAKIQPLPRQARKGLQHGGQQRPQVVLALGAQVGVEGAVLDPNHLRECGQAAEKFSRRRNTLV